MNNCVCMVCLCACFMGYGLYSDVCCCLVYKHQPQIGCKVYLSVASGVYSKQRSTHYCKCRTVICDCYYYHTTLRDTDCMFFSLLNKNSKVICSNFVTEFVHTWSNYTIITVSGKLFVTASHDVLEHIKSLLQLELGFRNVWLIVCKMKNNQT